MDIRDIFYELILIIFILYADLGLSHIEDVEYYEPSFSRCPSIHSKLKNGRVRYIDKGRIAKFLCDRRFELVGRTSATCLRGEWNNPVPVCVARGCNRVRSLTNGHVTSMYRGAILVFVCNPGYALDGSAAIHCDGRRWNTTPPLCIGNSSTIQTTDDSTPRASTFNSRSMFYTTLQNSEETSSSATNIQREKLESTKDPLFISSSILTSNSTTLRTDTFTDTPFPFETQSNSKTTFLTDIKSSTMLKTKTSSSSTDKRTTRYVSMNSPISANRIIPVTISLEIANTSITSHSTSTRLQTNIPATKNTKITHIKQRTTRPINKLSTISETAKQSVITPVFVDSIITTDGDISSFAIDSSSAAATSNTELVSLPRIISTSVKKTYNLRTNKMNSTPAYTTTPGLNTSEGSLIVHSKEKNLGSILTTSRYLPSTSSAKQESVSTLEKLTTRNPLRNAFTGIYTSSVTSQAIAESLPQTTKFSNRYMKPTKNKFQKTPELNDKTKPSTVKVVVIVIIVIIAFILIIASLAYYIKKQKSQRQRKLSDGSDMRFLSKSDYNEI